MEINNKLKELRKQKNLNQDKVAELIGVSLSSYQKYEREKNSVTPSLDVLIKLAEFYGVSTDYLLGRTSVKAMTSDNNDPFDAFNLSLLEKKILEGYVKLPEDLRGDLIDFLQRSVKEVEEESNDITTTKQELAGDIHDRIDSYKQKACYDQQAEKDM